MNLKNDVHDKIIFHLFCGFVFDLAYAFARQLEHLSELVESVGAVFFEAVVIPEYAAFPVIEFGDGVDQLLL